jgi:hypothetical protein
MTNTHDSWNQELIMIFSEPPYNVTFLTEDLQMGRHGLDVYFGMLMKEARGDWVIYFCDDHLIIYDGWDTKLLYEIEQRKLDPKVPNVVVPVFDNAGTMNHILSRGWVKAVGGRVARHGWVDSYINAVLYRLFRDDPSDHLVKNIDAPLFHDFTHDAPAEPVIEPVPPTRFDSDYVMQLIQDDADKVKNHLNI